MFENSKTVQLARELAHAMREEECYIQMEAAAAANDADESLHENMVKFQTIQNRMQLLSSNGTMSDDDNEAMELYQRQLMDVYNDIMVNPNMRAYQAAYGQFEKLMKFVDAIIGAGASGGDIDAVDEDCCCDECGGDCGSCGGCH